MVAKKTEDKDESLEDRMDGSQDIFDTPRMQCLKLKTDLLRKARHYKFWGHDKSRQRVVALDALLRYCRQSIDLAEWGTELRGDVHMDISSFLLENHTLPLPGFVREKLKNCVDDYVKTQDQEIPFLMAELQELRNNALTEFENEEWSNLEEFNQYSFDLRALRKKMYTEEWNKDTEHAIFFDVQYYEDAVKMFLHKYKRVLSKREIGIWKRKVKDTLKFASGILGFQMDEELREIEDSGEDGKVDISETNAKRNPEERFEKNVAEETLEVKTEPIVSEVKEFFEAVKLQESIAENLPNVPLDEAFDDQSSLVDEELEARLLKLKFFRKTWCSEEPSDQTEPKEETPPDEVKTSKPKRKLYAVKDVPIYSTKEETEEFNNWYLQKIGANSNTSADAFAFNSEVQATKVVSEQDETPIPVSGVYMDKEVDHDHTKNLSSPCTRNLFEGPNSLHSNLYMESMLVLFLAILKLINFSYPKLSYVPGVFPAQPYPDPDPSVPSSACGPILVPMERRLTRTSRQVVLSHVAKGYLSRLRDTVWEMLQRGKTSAGLRFMQVGEMLLA